MKKRSLFLFLSLSFTALLLINCKKNNKPLSCSSDNSYQSTLKTNNHELAARSVILNDSSFIKLTNITSFENANISSDVANLINNYNIAIDAGSSVLGLAIYFRDTLETGEIEQYSPLGLTVYSKKDNKMFGKTYFRNETDGGFTELAELSGITTFVSSNDLSNIAVSLNDETKEVVILLIQSQITDKIYDTELQHKIKSYLRPIGGGNGDFRYYSQCNSVPECERWMVEGWCVVQERQNGPSSSTCYPKKDFCPTQSTNRVLGNNGYSVGDDKTNDLYIIRDNFLVNSVKGSEYIDNYYYANSVLNFDDITLPFALSVWNLYENGFINRFKTTIQNNSENSVIIDNETKVLLLNLCAKAKALSNDQRFQSIISKVEIDILLYSNKTYGTIKNSL